jgi:hypothetical protein
VRLDLAVTVILGHSILALRLDDHGVSATTSWYYRNVFHQGPIFPTSRSRLQMSRLFSSSSVFSSPIWLTSRNKWSTLFHSYDDKTMPRKESCMKDVFVLIYRPNVTSILRRNKWSPVMIGHKQHGFELCFRAYFYVIYAVASTTTQHYLCGLQQPPSTQDVRKQGRYMDIILQTEIYCSRSLSALQIIQWAVVWIVGWRTVLTLIIVVVTICTTWFNIFKLCSLPKEWICAPYVFQTIKSDSFLNQYLPVHLCGWDVVCFLWGTNWIYIYILLGGYAFLCLCKPPVTRMSLRIVTEHVGNMTQSQYTVIKIHDHYNFVINMKLSHSFIN